MNATNTTRMTIPSHTGGTLVSETWEKYDGPAVTHHAIAAPPLRR
jgi:hypothetical protein